MSFKVFACDIPIETLFSGISAISALISIVAIYVLVKDRIERNRPYLQISYELIRSSLACIVLKNVGDTPLTLLSLKFNSEFINQLNAEKIASLNSKGKTDINIFPHNLWVISLDVNSFEIINTFSIKTIIIEYEYSKINHRRKYSEHVEINFEEFRGLLLYVSETDELKTCIKQGLDKMEKSSQTIISRVTELQSTCEKYIAYRKIDMD